MEYIVYKLRWIILTGILACSFIRGYFPSMFAMANGALSVYLQVSPAQSDILTSIDNGAAVFVCLFMIVVGQRFGTRSLSLTTSISLGICCTTIAISITRRDLYILMLAGRAISGIAAGLLYVLPPIFANAWFPPNQVATATALSLLAMCIAGFSAPIVFSKLLPKLNVNQTYHENNIYENSSEVEVSDFSSVRRLFIGNMSVFLVLAVLSTVIFIAFAKNHPPTPPSKAQAELIKRNDQNEHNPGDQQKRFNKFLKIVSIRHFWLVVATNVMSSSALVFGVFILPSVVKAAFPSIDPAVIGYLAAVTIICSAVGSIVAGKTLDNFGRYRAFCMLATASCTAFGVMIYFGQAHRIMELLFVGYGALNFARMFAFICTVELLLETTYPLDRTISTSLFFLFYNLSLFSWTLLLRQVMNLWGEENVVWLVVIANAAATLCLLMVPLEYKRSFANKSTRQADESEIKMIKS